MKRRRRSSLRWLIPLFLAVLAAVFVYILLKPREKAGPEPAKSGGIEKSEKTPAAPPVPAARKPAGPMAAIIVDDLGYSLEALENIQAIGCPVTVAILPYASLTAESVRLAEACGFEIILHLPLESVEAKNGAPSIAGTIFEGMPDAEVRAAVEKALDRVPGARGVNNHTGSLATEEARVMRPVFEVLKTRRLYFIDSRTSSGSIAYREARKAGIRAAARNVFLDAEPGADRIGEKLGELLRLAKKHGRAVGICHPKRESLAALAMQIGLAEAHGVKLVFASEIVD